MFQGPPYHGGGGHGGYGGPPPPSHHHSQQPLLHHHPGHPGPPPPFRPSTTPLLPTPPAAFSFFGSGGPPPPPLPQGAALDPRDREGRTIVAPPPPPQWSTSSYDPRDSAAARRPPMAEWEIDQHREQEREARERERERERDFRDREAHFASRGPPPPPHHMRYGGGGPPPMDDRGPPFGHPDRARFEYEREQHRRRMEMERSAPLLPPQPLHLIQHPPPPHMYPPPPQQHHHAPPPHMMPPSSAPLLPLPAPHLLSQPSSARPGALPMPSSLPPQPAPLPPPPPRALPLPPPPPASMLTGAGAAPPQAWRVYRTAPPEHKEYYFNTVTERAQWQCPVELLPDLDRPLPPCRWTEHKNEDGITYFASIETGQSVWQRPLDLIEYEEAKRLRDELIAKRKAEQPETPVLDLSANAVETKIKDMQAKLQAKKDKVLRKKLAAAAAATAASTAAAAAAATATADEGEVAAGSALAAGSATTPDVSAVDTAPIASSLTPAQTVAASAATHAAAPAASISTPAYVSASVAAVHAGPAEDPVYATKEEARAAFRSLLVDKNITSRMKNFAQDVLPLIGNDARYRALKTLPERKKAYLSYMEEVVKQEQEIRKEKEAVLMGAFQELLVETVEIDAKSKFKTSVALLETDDRYRALHTMYLTERVAAGSTDARLNLETVHMKLEELFYQHVDALAQKEKLALAAKRLAQAEAFKQLLREHTELNSLEASAVEELKQLAEKDEGEIADEEEEGAISAESLPARPPAPRWITASTTWRQLKKRVELTSDPRWTGGPPEADAFELFESWASKLVKIAREKEQQARDARRQKEKSMRKEFRVMLTEEAKKGNMHGRSRWKEVFPHIQEDARYTGLVEFYVQSESSSSRDRDRDEDKKAAAIERLKEYFLDVVAELAEKHEPTKKALKSILKDLHLSILPNHTPEQLTKYVSTHPQWSSTTESIPSAEIACVWRELVSKVQAKVSYFHSRQKAEQIKIVGKMLRGLYASNSSPTADAQELLKDAEAIQFEQCKQKIVELQQPILVPAPVAPVKEEEEPEEGAIEEGEMADVPAPPVMKPRHHPAYVAEGIAAWRLLECPPIPAPGADPTAPPPATAAAPFTTDEYTREAVSAFKVQLKSDIEAAELKRIEKEKHKGENSRANDSESEEHKSGRDSSRKRRRSRSSSRSQSRSRSHSRSKPKSSSNTSASKFRRSHSRSQSPAPKRKRDEDAKKAATSSAASSATKNAPAPAAMEDAEEGEL